MAIAKNIPDYAYAQAGLDDKFEFFHIGEGKNKHGLLSDLATLFGGGSFNNGQGTTYNALTGAVDLGGNLSSPIEFLLDPFSSAYVELLSAIDDSSFYVGQLIGKDKIDDLGGVIPGITSYVLDSYIGESFNESRIRQEQDNISITNYSSLLGDEKSATFSLFGSTGGALIRAQRNLLVSDIEFIQDHVKIRALDIGTQDSGEINVYSNQIDFFAQEIHFQGLPVFQAGLQPAPPAQTPSAPAPATQYWGNESGRLGTPDYWISAVVGGTNVRIPCYNA